MGENDGLILLGLGGLIGAAIASPAEKELFNRFKKEQDKFKRYLAEKQKFNLYLVEKNNYERWKSQRSELEKRAKKISIEDLDQLKINDKKIATVVKEALLTFYNGFYRSAVFNSIAVLEIILKQELNLSERKPFIKIIELARDKQIISESDFNLINGIRIIRNESTHQLETVPERDAVIIMNIFLKILIKKYGQ